MINAIIGMEGTDFVDNKLSLLTRKNKQFAKLNKFPSEVNAELLKRFIYHVANKVRTNELSFTLSIYDSLASRKTICEVPFN